MNNQTFIQKVKSFISNHKIWSFIILLVIIFLVYLFFFKSKTTTETKYVSSAVSKGNIIVSVSGTGQIESADTININAKVSGDVISVPVKVGQEVKKGTLIASMDSRDARIVLETAQLSLDKIKKLDPLTVLQKENSTIKTYTDGWNNTSAFLIDMNVVVTGMYDISNGYLGYKNKMLLSESGKIKLDASEKAYWEAKKSLDTTTSLYKTLSINSSKDEIKNLISKTLDTAKVVSNGVKLTQASLDYTIYSLDATSTTDATNNQKNLTSWTATTNNYLNSIATNLNNINESSQSLSDTLAGADELDIRQAELNLETKQNSYNDYFIRAPFDGIIATLTAKVGQTASGSIGTLIAKQKIVKISLNEVDIAKIKLGQKATLSFDAIDGLTITGKVDGIDSVGTVSQGVVTYNVTIVLDVDDARVKPGMSVSATIITDTAQDVVIVPSSAVKEKNGVSYVETLGLATSTVTDSQGLVSTVKPISVNITVGLVDDMSSEIISGLKEGDIIITKTITTSTSAKTTTAPSILGAVGGNKAGASSGAMRSVMGH